MDREKNIFDKIGSLIPGYRGYAERDGRRNCDKLLRNNISDQITKFENVLNTRMKNEIKNNNFAFIQDLEECRQKLNTFSDKIKYAPYGESSFFSDSQIKEDELYDIYQLDYDMLVSINEYNEAIHTEEITNIQIFIDSITNMLENRNNYIKELK